MMKTDKLNFAIVGTNFISDWFSECARLTEGINLKAVYSRKSDTGESFAQKYGIEKVYTDYAEMLKDESIDAVYIASPIIMHKEQAVLAMKHKKHVLVEKMIAESYESFLEMKEAQRDSGVVLLEAMRPEFDPAYDKVRDLLLRIGAIRRASLDFCQYSSRYDKYKNGIIENAFKREMFNSALSDIGIYPLHVCISLFGSPKTVSSYSVKLSDGFDGAGSILLGYKDMYAQVSYSKISDGVIPSVIEGESGSVLINKITSPTEITLVLRSGEIEKFEFPQYPNNMVHEIRAFADMVRGKRDFKKELLLTESVMKTVRDVYKISEIF